MAKSNRLRRVLETGVSVAALSVLATPAVAQNATASDNPGQPAGTPANATSTLSEGEVIVTARRAAINSAIKRKELADTIVDSVQADEAGKLPDNSITEVLQRVVGVTITRFAAVGDPDHFSTEGSGVAVRGLTGVTSTLNGRESFSANGGRGLLWEDVPPELMAGVDVYKANTSDLLEGGIAGAINLRTRMPFDTKGQHVSGSLGVNRGDIAKHTDPQGSILYSNRWDTSIGEMGLLVDAAYSDISSGSNALQVEPYFAQVWNGQNVYIPGGFDYRKDDFSRKRLGLYEAFQWAPTDNLTIFQTAFRSSYRNHSVEYGIYNGNGNTEAPASQTGTKFGPNGGLLETDSLVYTGWSVVPCPNGGSCGYEQSNIGVNHSFNQTTDISGGFNWQPSSRLAVRGAIQYVRSTAHSSGYNTFGESTVPAFKFDVTGNLPVFGISEDSNASDPSKWFWYATMDHIEKHAGREIAGNLDADLTASETGFLRKLKFGVRYADRTEDDNVSTYNWVGLTPWWSYWSGGSAFPECSSDVGSLHCFAHYPASTYQIVNFNLFHGKAILPSGVFPSNALTEAGNMAYLHQTFGLPGDTTVNTTFTPATLTQSYTRTAAAYVRADFAADNLLGMKMNGNFGLRLVHNDNHSAGFVQQPTDTVVWSGNCTTTAPLPGTCNLPGGFAPNAGGRKTTNVLPSFNLQFLPTPNVHIRFAASKGITLPSFNNASAAGNIGIHESNLPQGMNLDPNSPQTYTTANIGNPNLKPQISDNYDISLEWYLPHNGLMHVGLFDKRIHNYISYGIFAEPLGLLMPDGTTKTYNTLVTNEFNGQTATVKGVEAGFTKFFDFLPGLLSGFGVDTNFAYINSKAPGDLSYDMLGNRIHGLPVDLLSKYNFNVTAMYEKGPISLRLAYSWRSKYLLTAGAYGTNGTYTDATLCAGNPETHTAAGTCSYALPVFGANYGQLDFGATFKFSEHVSLSIDAQNLTNAVTRTLMGYGAQQYGRSWFIGDRRYSAQLRFGF